VYARARALAVRVRAAGHPEWARQIDDSLATGATAAETLVTLGWVCAELERLPDLDAELDGDILSLDADIRALLGRT
jgi:hypothetical protein